ncbi:N-acetylmuramoyl-L-alanine amidase family protein [Paenibacillus urinalis]|uniref:N-acetylmuramoyl-L-alanine amidase family protein n=2 Tax=Paenibacillus TaxID=44249 RepID=A0AAX3MXS7_9BACL|nr:N-acetylmuramoyl-L-alanine amidase family protein [Paenibacillus urinalis]WDH81179.1 N-acetylmuramoyl-L-alanine amidase family protein [Paenibacillus urinalis]WDH97231.1 N-acetylmuramoyl-L-alanine amidase family protein [Paenibacillus urinalis]WDI00894.1 N-acetylmuramoyl-L-alanine amidase family protein [Paenibacillus urinalis]
MKKLKVLVALLCFMWIFPGLGQAATDIKIVLDGSQLSLPSGVKAENINSKVMIPIRVVSEKLGYSVGWEQKTKTVTIKQDQTVIKMVAGKKTATVNGSTVNLDAAPIIKNGTTLVPIRFVGETMGLQVSWNNQSKTVYLNSNSGSGGSEIPPAGGNGSDSNLIQVNGISFTDSKLMIATSGGAAPTAFKMSAPDRVVVDIPNAEFSSLFADTQALDITKSIAGQIVVDGYEGVEKVRYALFSNDPSTVRVVIDLSYAMNYKMTSSNAGLITVTLDTDSGTTTPPATKKKTVVIDAGHGDQDPGAIGVTGKYEKNFTLTMALKIEQLLKKEPGINVITTRDDDTFLELSERVKIANNAKADVFLSIHANAGPASATGSETYYNRSNSKSLANTVHKYMVQAAGLRDRGVKTGNFAVIRDTTMPAILLEVGFLSNKNDEAALFNTTFQNRVAEGVVKGIKEYLGL